MTANLTHPRSLVGLVVGVFFLSFLPVYGQPYSTLVPPDRSFFTSVNGLFEQALAVNQPPAASFSFEPSRPVKHYPVIFNATSSSDPDGTITLYVWDFGDGTTNSTTAPVISHTYDSTNTYTVTLTVTDDQNATASFAGNVNVNSANTFPTASFTVTPSAAYEGDTLRFDATASRDPDVGGGIVSYLWLFGDRTYQNGGNATATTAHSYSSYGFYQVTLTVTDNSGAVSSATRGVNILQGLSLSLSSDKTQGTAPLFVSLSAQASGGQGPYEFSWNFGDGEIALGQTLIHNYTEPGDYQVQVGVADSAGHTTFKQLTITVTETSGAGVFDFGLGTAPYVVTGIVGTGIGMVVLLLVYAFMVRRTRQKETPTYAKSNRPSKRDGTSSGGRR